MPPTTLNSEEPHIAWPLSLLHSWLFAGGTLIKTDDVITAKVSIYALPISLIWNMLFQRPFFLQLLLRK